MGGLFGDLFDDVVDVVSDVAEPFTDLARDAAEVVGLDTKVDLVDLAILAAFLGIEVGIAKAAIAAGCGTVGEVKDWSNHVGGGGSFGGGGASV